jgi:hypothetical protein
MDVCRLVDDIVWSQSDRVWDDTFVLIMRETRCVSQSLVNKVMRWTVTQAAEYEAKYLKVVEISQRLSDAEGVGKLVFHYQNIMLRYRLANDSCKAVELFL